MAGRRATAAKTLESMERREDKMDDRAFGKPIYLKDGKYLIREIASVEDAIYFLEEWPDEKRDALHDIALKTCFLAHDGHKPAKVARDAMRAFGAKKGILVKEPAVQPWMITPETGGRVPA
jgi:hypothetical protein